MNKSDFSPIGILIVIVGVAAISQLSKEDRHEPVANGEPVPAPAFASREMSERRMIVDPVVDQRRFAYPNPPDRRSERARQLPTPEEKGLYRYSIGDIKYRMPDGKKIVARAGYDFVVDANGDAVSKGYDKIVPQTDGYLAEYKGSKVLLDREGKVSKHLEK